MRKSISYSFIIAIIIILFTSSSGFAADAMFRLMHNDHDALVIGKVIEVSGNQININVEKQIISSKDLNSTSPRKQITLDGTITIGEIKKYALFYGNNSEDSSPQEGDYILISLNKEGNKFVPAWGIFKVDSADPKTLNIMYPEGSSMFIRMDAAAIKVFVNSNGKKNEFAFDGNTGKVYSEGKVIFNGSTENGENIIEENISKSISSDEKKGEAENYTINFNREPLMTIAVIVSISFIVAFWFQLKKKSN